MVSRKLAAAGLIAACALFPLSALSTDTEGPLPSPAARASVAPEPSAPAALPAAAESPRDGSLWPQGYYPGDPLPPKTIYLSFDDGPTDFTGQILDVLKEKGVRATFFLNSYDKDSPLHADPRKNCLIKYADVLRRMVADGHAIGNHTYSHQDLSKLSAAQIDFQLSTLERQLGEVLGDRTPRLFLIRPPFGSPWYGAYNSDRQRRAVASSLSRRGLVMLWSMGWDSSDSADWAKGEWFEPTAARYHPGTPSYQAKMDRELARILKIADGARSGVILMHDTHPTSRDVLGALIDELKRRGYAFDTLEDYCRWRWGPGVFDRFAAAEAVLPAPPARPARAAGASATAPSRGSPPPARPAPVSGCPARKGIR